MLSQDRTSWDLAWQPTSASVAVSCLSEGNISAVTPCPGRERAVCEARTLVIFYIHSSHSALTAFVILSRKLSFEISRIMPTHTQGGPGLLGGRGAVSLPCARTFQESMFSECPGEPGHRIFQAGS